MYKDFSPPNVHAVNIHMLLLVYQLRLLLALTLFPRLICLVSVMLCNFNCEDFMERFGIVLVFVISTIALLISESLLGKTPVTVAIL